MSLSLPFRLATAALIAFMILITGAHAGGSFSREEFLGAIQDTDLRQYVAEHFELAEDGRAFRAGHSQSNAGERLPPYEILARSTSGTAAPLVLRLETNRAVSLVVSTCAESRHYSSKCE